jgi:hypothetical protein
VTRRLPARGEFRGRVTPDTRVKVEAQARAAAAAYLSGEKIRKWESPKKQAQHGGWVPMSRRLAAIKAYNNVKRIQSVSLKWPSVYEHKRARGAAAAFALGLEFKLPKRGQKITRTGRVGGRWATATIAGRPKRR